MRIMVHVHTSLSNDGDLDPQQVADLAARNGFDAVLLSDHFESLTRESFETLVRRCRRIANCWMIPGYERSWNGYHVLALGVAEWYDDPDIATWAQRIRAHGGLTVLAHPVRYGFNIPAYILEACDAVEVWNSKFAYDGSFGPNPRAFELLGSNRFPLCGQDLHGTRHLSSVSVILYERCTSIRNVIHSLRSGKFRMANSVFRFGSALPPVVPSVLTLMHSVRARGVRAAIHLRRNLRSSAIGRLRARRQSEKSEAAHAEN
jgi:hypothetical protein